MSKLELGNIVAGLFLDGRLLRKLQVLETCEMLTGLDGDKVMPTMVLH